MNRRRRASQVIDLIYLQQYRLHNVVTNQLKPRVREQMNQIVLPPSEEIINHNYLITARNQLIHEMAPDESSSTGDHNSQPPTAKIRRYPTGDRPPLNSVMYGGGGMT
ncbi:hypothetical protein LINPERHAP2_LOCUS8797 [Linum perenne]